MKTIKEEVEQASLELKKLRKEVREAEEKAKKLISVRVKGK